MADKINTKLQILITQYCENESVIKYLLNSIQSQININFYKDISVIIINDGSNIILSEQFLQKYEFNIDYYINEKNLGVSACRNIALEKSTSNYICFCDADDIFLTNDILYYAIQIMEEKQLDLLISPFIYENKDKNPWDSKIYYNYLPTIHGKFINRSFLINNNIKWQQNLLSSEEYYFFSLCNYCTNNIFVLDKPCYLYRYNQNSLTRQNPEKYFQDNIKICINSFTYLVQELINRDKIIEAKQELIKGFYNFYYLINKEKIDKTLESQINSQIQIYYIKFLYLFNSISEIEKNTIFYSNFYFLNKIEFEKWLNKIKGKTLN